MANTVPLEFIQAHLYTLLQIATLAFFFSCLRYKQYPLARAHRLAQQMGKLPLYESGGLSLFYRQCAYFFFAAAPALSLGIYFCKPFALMPSWLSFALFLLLFFQALCGLCFSLCMPNVIVRIHAIDRLFLRIFGLLALGLPLFIFESDHQSSLIFVILRAIVGCFILLALLHSWLMPKKVQLHFPPKTSDYLVGAESVLNGLAHSLEALACIAFYWVLNKSLLPQSISAHFAIMPTIILLSGAFLIFLRLHIPSPKLRTRTRHIKMTLLPIMVLICLLETVQPHLFPL